METFALPKKSEEEKLIRNIAIQAATKSAILIPFKVMETAFSGFELIKEMVEKGNPNSITDAGVGALALRSSVIGAFLNIKINSSGLDDKNFLKTIFARCNEIEEKTITAEAEILDIINSNLNAK